MKITGTSIVVLLFGGFMSLEANPGVPWQYRAREPTADFLSTFHRSAFYSEAGSSSIASPSSTITFEYVGRNQHKVHNTGARRVQYLLRNMHYPDYWLESSLGPGEEKTFNGKPSRIWVRDA